MIVKDADSLKEIRLKNYLYPAYYEEKYLKDQVQLQDGTGPADLKQIDFTKSKGIIFMIHGFSDYSCRFTHGAQYFSQQGYDYFCMDQRGHGKSGGQVVYIPSMDEVVNDSLEF